MPQSDTNNKPATLQCPLLNQPTEEFERAQKALEAVNEAARTARNLYISFLGLGTYIGVIIASTTDEQLLRVSTVTLPILNVKLPIVGFYLVVPWLFLLFHFNLLLQFSLLSQRKYQPFQKSLETLSEEQSEALQNRLLNFPLLQMLMGQRSDRFMERVLALIIWITVIVLPLGLLVWAQLAFAAYHHTGYTFVQWIVVVLDAMVISFFWLRIEVKTSLVLLTAICCIHVLASSMLTLGTGGVRIIGLDRNLDLAEMVLTANTLPAEVMTHLRGEDEEKRKSALEKVLEINLQGRDLRYANLIRSILPKADLRDAELQGANLQRADLQGANLQRADLQGAYLRGAQLQGANLQRADLQGANLRGADLQGANLWVAQLQGANLQRAQLQGAVLVGADLQGANLRGADLQGANLRVAQLQGAALVGADLQGAYLKGAQLQGADLQEAQLQGADLEVANLQGANLQMADLQGAYLVRAYIGGADFESARLDIADLRSLDRTPLSEIQYQKLSEELAAIQDEKQRTRVLERLQERVNQEDTLDWKWVFTAEQCLSDDPPLHPSCVTEDTMVEYRTALSDCLVKIACGSSFTARSLARRAVDNANADFGKALLEADCEAVKQAVKQLPDETKERLQRLSAD